MRRKRCASGFGLESKVISARFGGLGIVRCREVTMARKIHTASSNCEGREQGGLRPRHRQDGHVGVCGDLRPLCGDSGCSDALQR